jgi:hypothetical protein
MGTYDTLKMQEILHGTIYCRTDKFPFASKMFLFLECAHYFLDSLPIILLTTNYSVVAKALGGIDCGRTIRRMNEKILKTFFKRSRGGEEYDPTRLGLLSE